MKYERTLERLSQSLAMCLLLMRIQSDTNCNMKFRIEWFEVEEEIARISSNRGCEKEREEK